MLLVKIKYPYGRHGKAVATKTGDVYKCVVCHLHTQMSHRHKEDRPV